MGWSIMGAREAIASVAMSHGPGHGCVVCRAHRGDEAAAAEVAVALAEDVMTRADLERLREGG